jgi:hypothetical protein
MVHKFGGYQVHTGHVWIAPDMRRTLWVAYESPIMALSRQFAGGNAPSEAKALELAAAAYKALKPKEDINATK